MSRLISLGIAGLWPAEQAAAEGESQSLETAVSQPIAETPEPIPLPPLLRPAPDPSTYSRQRIFGTETEFGTVGWRSMPYGEFLANGGRRYTDLGHIEYASPETRDPLSAVLWEKAGEALCEPHATKLYKNNVDSAGNTFGAHENYFTTAAWNVLLNAVPFLATRQIFAGSGHLNEYGFEIAQKSRFIQQVYGSSTTRERALLCTKSENHAHLGSWYRLHLIHGDANMCENAAYLKLATTGLVLDLAEDNMLPSITWLSDRVVGSVHTIARQTAGWRFEAVKRSPKATDIQRMYLEAAVKSYQGRDAMTDDILRRWDAVLDALDRDPMELVGIIDWVTKKALMDSYSAKHPFATLGEQRLRNIDLQYHDTDQSTSLFYALQRAGRTHRLLTDEKISYAASQPPANTRAYARGTLLTALANSTAPSSGHVDVDWEGLTAIYCRTSTRREPPMPFQVGLDMQSPFDTYTKNVEDALAKLTMWSKG
jgi:Pup amidohydrolase